MFLLRLLRELAAAFVAAFKRSEAHWKREAKRPSCSPAEASEAVLRHTYTPYFKDA